MNKKRNSPKERFRALCKFLTKVFLSTTPFIKNNLTFSWKNWSVIIVMKDRNVKRRVHNFGTSVKTIISLAQAKSPHGGVGFSRSAHLMQLRCDCFLLYKDTKILIERNGLTSKYFFGVWKYVCFCNYCL